MARYIDADKLKQDLVDLYDFAKWDPREIHFSLFDMVGNIDGEPTADVAPVVHAHWIYIKHESPSYTHKCSNCGGGKAFHSSADKLLNNSYCSRCGAIMDEVVQ